MAKRYRATTLKEIYWQGKTYRDGVPIELNEDDARILLHAGVIGDLNKIEFAVNEAPENAMIKYKRGRPKNATTDLHPTND